VIDFAAHRDHGHRLHLTPKELDLLRYLTQHATKAAAPRTAAGRVGPDYGDQVDYLRVFIKSLRKKIEPNPGDPNTSLPGLGRLPLHGRPEPSDLHEIFMPFP
jgi:two-component system KDP operon response regulator KdpE